MLFSNRLRPNAFTRVQRAKRAKKKFKYFRLQELKRTFLTQLKVLVFQFFLIVQAVQKNSFYSSLVFQALSKQSVNERG